MTHLGLYFVFLLFTEIHARNIFLFPNTTIKTNTITQDNNKRPLKLGFTTQGAKGSGGSVLASRNKGPVMSSQQTFSEARNLDFYVESPYLQILSHNYLKKIK